MKNIALIVMSCDKYLHLFEMWHYYYLKNVNLDIPIYVVNETKIINIKGVKQILINEPDINKWTYRLREAVKQVPEDNIFLCMDDVCFVKSLKGVIENLYLFFQGVGADSVRISTVASNRVTHTQTGFKISNLEVRRINQNSWYTTSYEPNIWKKDHLLRCLPLDESPWASEIEGSKRLHKIDHKSYFYLSEGSHVNVIQKGKITTQGQIIINEYENSISNNNVQSQ